MTPISPPESNAQEALDEEAALWFTRQHSQKISAEQSKQFEVWLNASPEHARAYEAIAAIWRDFDAMPRPASAPQSLRKKRFFQLWRPLGNTLAALFIAAILFLPYSHLPSMLLNNMTLAATDMPKKVTLSDGSQLFLNRETRVRVAYETEIRHVYLEKGNVYFKVKSNPYRPFVIQADERRIQVVGTEFEVDKSQQQITVTVSQGIVSFQTGKQQQTAYLFAGDSAVSAAVNSAISIHKIAPLDVARWRFGELSFTDKPLADVLTELKTYSSTLSRLISTA